MLTPDKLKTLNDNARKMVSLGKSKEDILAMKDAFMDRFGSEEEVAPIKKKSTTASPLEQNQEDVSSGTSTMEIKKPSVSSGSAGKRKSVLDTFDEISKVFEPYSAESKYKERQKELKKDINKAEVKKDLSEQEMADALGWNKEDIKKATAGTGASKLTPAMAKPNVVTPKGEGFEEKTQRNTVKAYQDLGKNANQEKLQERKKYYDVVDNQKYLKDQGYDIDVNGKADDEKTLKAIKKDQAKTKVIEQEAIKSADVDSKINSIINEDFLNNEEEEAVVKLRKNFSKDGFYFEESGLGDNIIVEFRPDGITASKRIEIPFDNSNLFGANSSSAKELNAFMKQAYMTKSEKNELNNADDLGKVIKLMASNPYKYGEELIDEDLKENFLENRNRQINQERKSLQLEYKDLESKINNYNANPDPVEKKYIDNKMHELSLKEYKLNERDHDVRNIEKNYSKATAVYYKGKEEKGNFIGNLSSSFVSGITNIEKTALEEVADVLPSVLGAENVLNPVQYQQLKDEGMSDDDIMDYASKELKRGVLQNIKDGIIDVGSLGSTTKEYKSSEDRGVLENVGTFLAESIGTSLSGGGNPGLTRLAFFTQSYNGMKDQMVGEDFDGLSEGEKTLIAVPYGLVVGALEKFGYDASLGFSKSGIFNKAINGILRKTLTELPKDATVETLKRTINAEVSNLVKSGAIKIAAGSITEGAVEGMQSLTETSTKNIVNQLYDKDLFKGVPDLTTKKGVMEALDMAKTDAAYGVLGGLIMSGASISKQTYKQAKFNETSDYKFDLFYNSMMDDKLRKSIEYNTKLKVKNGEITKEEALEEIESIRKITGVLKTIPTELSNRDKKESFNLILEKQKLETEIEGKNDNLVAPKKARIEEINNELKTIGENATKESNKQEGGTEGDIVQREGTDVGQQEVGQGEGAVGETAQPSADNSDSNISSQEEEIIIPTEELDILNEEISKRKDEGTVVDNLNQKAFIGNEPGMIKIDSENENTVVFETKDKIIELGNIDKIKDKDIASLNLSLFPEAGVIVNDKTKAVTVDGKEYTIIGRRRDKKGQAVVRVKEVATGLERRIIGEKAEIILKDAALAPKETVAPIETKIAPEQEVAKPIKEKITPVTENQDFTLDEIQAEESRLNKEAAKFEEDLLKQISKESKKEKKLIFKVKDSEFSVTAKPDGTFSVSQKNAEGKFVGIKDDAKRKRVVSEYKKLREGNDSNRLKDAEDLSGMFKKEQDDKILSLLDRAIEATSGKGKAFDATLGLPMFVANTSLKIIKASYKAGKSLSEAIKDGYKFVKDNNYKISEYEFKKFVAENVNKKQETADVLTKEAVSEEEDVKINPKDMSALKTQIKNEARAIRDKVKQIKQVLNDISDATKELVTKGSITLKQSQAIINAVKKINFNSNESIKKTIDYISKIYKNADFARKVDKAKEIRKGIKSRIKDAPGAFKNTAKSFAEIDPRWVESIDAYNEIAELVKDSVTKARARGGKLTAKDEADINQVNTYTLKEQERQQKMRDNMLRERYANLMEITFDEATKIDMAQIKTELADSKVTEDFTEANKEAIREGIEKYNEMVDEDTDQRVKDILNFDLGLLSTKFQLEMIDTLDSYFMNGSITNLDKLTGSYKGIKGINDFVGKARSLKLLFNKSAGNRKAKELTNFNLIIEKIFVNRAVAKRFMDSIGFYDIVNGVNKAETQSKRKENDFAKKFKNEIKNGMMSAENTFEAGVIANLSRQMATGDNAKFFKDRLKMLKESVDVMRNSEDDQEVADADVYEKVFNKLGLYDDNVTLESIKEKAEPMNVEGAAYMVDMFSEVYPELSDLSLSMYNTELAKDINYTSDRYRFIKKAKETQLEKMNDSGFSLYNYVGNLKADKSGVLIESIRPENLPMDGYVDLNLYNNSFRAYKLGLKDLYTAKSIEQANSFINDKKFDKLFENNSNRELVKERLVRYVTDAKGKIYSKEDNLRALNKASEVIGLFGGARALAGASQAATQFATAMTNTYLNAGEYVRMFTDLSNGDFWKKVADNGLPISNVGLEVTSTLRRERDSIERAKADRGTGAKIASFIVDKAKIPNEFLLKYTLQKPDEAARLIGFATYYRQYMKENGFKGSALDGDFNMDAANYAQSMIDRNMDVTDTRLRGDLYTSNKILVKLIKQVLFPFSSFRMNLRDRLTTDLRSLSINSSSKYGVTPGQKVKAIRSLSAIGAEMVVYNGIRFAIGKAMIYAAAGILGYDDDEIDEFVDKQTANLWKSVISNASTELFSPVPYTDDLLLKAMNWMLKTTGIGDPSDNKVDEYIKKENNIRKSKGEDPLEGEELKAKREKFLTDNMFQFYVSDEISYGALGIQPKKFMELYDVINAYKTGEYETDYKGNITNKKLTEKGREKLKSAVIMKLWSTTIGDRDTDKLSNTIFKLVKEKEGMSETQSKKYEAVKKEYKKIDSYKKSLIESSMNLENVLEEIRFIEDSFGGFTKSQSEQYAEIRASIPVDIWMIDAIKSGKTAKEILNNPD